MNFFEEEFRKIFNKDNIFKDATFVGRNCLITIDKDIKAKLEFVTLGYADHYEALKIKILNRTEGVLDSEVIRFKDLLGRKKINHPNFKEGLVPHIWEYNGQIEWYAYKPTSSDYNAFNREIKEYIKCFQKEEIEEQGQTLQM